MDWHICLCFYVCGYVIVLYKRVSFFLCTYFRACVRVLKSFQTFFVQAFKIVVDSWIFTMLLAIHLMRWLTNFYDFNFKETATLLKPDCHSWWISKMQYGCEDTLEERYAIKFCFKPGKNASETYEMLQTAFRPSCMNRVSVFEWHKRF